MKERTLHSWWKTLAVTAAASIPGLAAAVDGPYIGAEGGANWEEPQNLSQGGAGLGTLHFNTGWIGGLDFGYSSFMGFRPEVELDYRHNDLKNLTGFGPALGASGFEEAYTAMGNLWYDFKAPTGLFHVVHPYLGGGLGGARVAIRHPNIGGTGFGNSYDTLFAYQGGAGLNFDVAPNVILSADWRFLQTNRGGYDIGAVGGPIDARYRSQSAMLGVKFVFGQEPPPPPPPAPAPPPVAAQEPPPPPPPPPVCNAPPGFKVDAECHIIQQTLVVRQVDFEFNSDKLTAPAQATLDEVAASLAQQPNLTVQINGYTDSIGAAAYNLRLSQRRAEAVRNYLAAKGVNPASLSAHGYGKANPIAGNDTDDGRAQNRRVEFVIANAPADVKVQQEGATAAGLQAAQQGQQPRSAKKQHRRRRHSSAATAPADQPAASPDQQAPPQ